MHLHVRVERRTWSRGIGQRERPRHSQSYGRTSSAHLDAALPSIGLPNTFGPGVGAAGANEEAAGCTTALGAGAGAVAAGCAGPPAILSTLAIMVASRCRPPMPLGGTFGL